MMIMLEIPSPEPITVYKVLRRLRNGKLVSVMMRRPIALDYALGVTTKPRIGAIMAFISHDDARRFVSVVFGCHSNNHELRPIFECRAFPALPPNSYGGEVAEVMWLNDSRPLTRLRQWWAGAAYGNTYYDVRRSVPEGTVFCSELTLIKEL